MVELIQDGGGLLYDADDPSALHACLERLYNEPGLGRGLASTAPPVKSIKENVAELSQLYESLISRTRSTLQREGDRHGL